MAGCRSTRASALPSDCAEPSGASSRRSAPPVKRDAVFLRVVSKTPIDMCHTIYYLSHNRRRDSVIQGLLKSCCLTAHASLCYLSDKLVEQSHAGVFGLLVLPGVAVGQRWRILQVMLFVSLALAVAATPLPLTWTSGTTEAAPDECRYFPETDKWLCHGFRAYWERFGGLEVFGFPITNEFYDPQTGLVVQWFERARFEWHPGIWPERYDVLLGLLGREQTQGRTDKAFEPAEPIAGCQYFGETGHNLCGRFREIWERYGGLPIFGYPISEEFVELTPESGRPVVVQYFERQRFEYQPGAWPQQLDVLLGRLGAEAQGLVPPLPQPAPAPQPTPTPTPTLTPTPTPTPRPLPTPAPTPMPTLTPTPTPTPRPLPTASPTPRPTRTPTPTPAPTPILLVGASQLALASDQCTSVQVFLRLVPGLPQTGVRGIAIFYRVAQGPNANNQWRSAGQTDSVGGVSFQHCAGGQVGVDTIEVCADLNRNDRCDSGEPRATERVWLGYQFRVDQSTEAQVVGEPVLVMYCAQLGNEPLSNIQVLFTVWPAGGTAFLGTSARTDQQGCATFDYRRDTLPSGWSRQDEIETCTDLNENGRCDGGFGNLAEPRHLVRIGWGTVDELRLFPVINTQFAYHLVNETRRFAVRVELVTQGGLVWGGVANQRVIASVNGANAWGDVASTGPDGHTSFEYVGENAGRDDITICLDLNRNARCELNEPQLIGAFGSTWIQGVQVTVSGAAVDGDPGTVWAPGDATPDLQLQISADESVPVIVEVVSGTAQVTFDANGMLVTRSRWTGSNEFPATSDLYIVSGSTGGEFTLRVYLDRNWNNQVDDEERSPIVERSIPLTG